MRRVAITLAVTALLGGSPPARAQEETPGLTASEIAAEFSDPLTTPPQIFLQDAYTLENHGTKAPGNRVIARVIVPRVPSSSLLPFVQLIRPSVSLVTVPTGKGSQTRTEFGDVQLFDLAVIPWPGRETGLLMGVGPTVLRWDEGGPFLATAYQPTLMNAIVESAKFRTRKKPTNAHPQDRLANLVGDRFAANERWLPPLRGIVRTPILRPDGSIFDDEGVRSGDAATPRGCAGVSSWGRFLKNPTPGRFSEPSTS